MVKKGQNCVHVVIECPLGECIFFQAEMHLFCLCKIRFIISLELLLQENFFQCNMMLIDSIEISIQNFIQNFNWQIWWKRIDNVNLCCFYK